MAQLPTAYGRSPSPLKKDRRVMKLPVTGGPVRAPVGIRGHDDITEGQQHRIVVDPPADKIPPSLITISLERYPGRRQLRAGGIELPVGKC